MANAYLITPDGELLDVSAHTTHEDYADEHGLTSVPPADVDDLDEMSDEYSDALWARQEKVMDDLFGQGYLRSRLYGKGRFGIQGDAQTPFISPELIEALIEAYRLDPKKAIIEYERGGSVRQGFEGSLSDYIARQDKKKRGSEMARMLADPRFFDPESGL